MHLLEIKSRSSIYFYENYEDMGLTYQSNETVLFVDERSTLNL